jgi:hypothetical protein
MPKHRCSPDRPGLVGRRAARFAIGGLSLLGASTIEYDAGEPLPWAQNAQYNINRASTPTPTCCAAPPAFCRREHVDRASFHPTSAA